MLETKTYQFDYLEGTVDDLTPEQRADYEAALMARGDAYAPYSNYHVGAYLRMNDGTIAHGWNAETITYDGIHAEESARARIPGGSRRSGLKRVTIVGAPAGDNEDCNPTAPCGGCRQKLLEFTRVGDNPEVVMAAVKNRVRIAGLRYLLPFAFFPDSISPVTKGEK
ncbi:MAG: cytidine deaminase [Candidatus Gracilibacteria bacterium]|jgi:cytidine deaminase